MMRYFPNKTSQRMLLVASTVKLFFFNSLAFPKRQEKFEQESI